VASIEADFDRKTATVTMKPGATLTSEQVAKAFAGSNYALTGAPELLDGSGPGS
jgi:hypothetical protein